MNPDNIQNALKKHGLDGWLFFDHHLRDPLAYRILGITWVTHATRRWYYFIPREGDPIKLVHRIEAGILDALPGRKVSYSKWQEQATCLADMLEGCRRVAMQYSPNCSIPYVAMVDAGTIELVRSIGVEVVSSADLVQEFEATWSREQFDMHVEAGRRVDAIRREAFRWIRHHLHENIAVREYDVYGFIRQGFINDGLVTDHGPIVGVNENSANPHYEPTAAVSSLIKEGDLVLIDMWAKINAASSVFYDITWTGVCGQPSDRAVEVFDVVRRARDSAIELVKTSIAAGRPLYGFQVDDCARGCIRDAGFAEYFTHRTGHSIGQDIHGAGANMDNLETHDDRRIVPNTCFSIEPGVYLGPFGVRSEVNVFISYDRAIVTGEIQNELVRI